MRPTRCIKLHRNAYGLSQKHTHITLYMNQPEPALTCAAHERVQVSIEAALVTVVLPHPCYRSTSLHFLPLSFTWLLQALPHFSPRVSPHVSFQSQASNQRQCKQIAIPVSTNVKTRVYSNEFDSPKKDKSPGVSGKQRDIFLGRLFLSVAPLFPLSFRQSCCRCHFKTLRQLSVAGAVTRVCQSHRLPLPPGNKDRLSKLLPLLFSRTPSGTPVPCYLTGLRHSLSLPFSLTRFLVQDKHLVN